MKIFDNVLPEAERKEVYDFLMDPGWMHGWKSRSATDDFEFWQKHLPARSSPIPARNPTIARHDQSFRSD